MKTKTSFAGLLAVSALTLAGIVGSDPQDTGANAGQNVNGRVEGQAGAHTVAGVDNAVEKNMENI